MHLLGLQYVAHYQDMSISCCMVIYDVRMEILIMVVIV